MSHPLYHARSSARRFGGKAEDYQDIHNWFDASKAHIADARHRALRHHAQGIFWAEEVFGLSVTNSAGREIPVRLVAEQHVLEDFGGRISTLQDWFSHFTLEGWMAKSVSPLPTLLEAHAPLPPLPSQMRPATLEEVEQVRRRLRGDLHLSTLKAFALSAYGPQAACLIRLEREEPAVLDAVGQRLMCLDEKHRLSSYLTLPEAVEAHWNVISPSNSRTLYLED